MEYKALMLDVDGTLIPYQYEALPSRKLINAVKKAKTKVHVCLVTGRSLKATRRILQALQITDGFAVVDGGAFVIDIKSETPVYESYVTTTDVSKIIRVFEEFDAAFYLKDENSRNNKRDHFEPYQKGQTFTKVSQFFTDEVFSLDQTHKIMSKLSSPGITIFRTRHKDPKKYGLNIAHITASKLHGVLEISERLSIKKEEIIGVGDGYNDFPLLMASGLKVAMGNAIPDLKAIADYVAPAVENDGVADVIEKFILKG